MSAEAKKSTVDTKSLLKTLASQKRKIKFNERKEVIILKDTKHYKKDAVIKPHITFAEELIKKGIAKAV